MTARPLTDAQMAKMLAKCGPPVERAVLGWMARRFQKCGSPDSVMVRYRADLLEFPEWLLLEHAGPGRYRAEKWWAAHGGALPVPADVAEMLDRWAEVTCPAAIVTRKNGSWHDIIGRVMVDGRTTVPKPADATAS